jgi:phage/plasmid-associated DNA primase
MNTISLSLFTTRFESLYIHTGVGGNGKGVLFGLVKNCIGDYFYTAGNTFLSTHYMEGVSNSALFNSKGRRIFCISEPDTESNKPGVSSNINVDFVKSITGGDDLNCKDLYKSATVFKPVFTCFLQCNQIPSLGKIDSAIQRRLKIMEYPFMFKENPKLKHERKIKLDLKDKLKDQKYIDEFMLMMIENATDFDLNNNSNSIPLPSCVDDNVNEYINDNDPTIDFLNKFYIITNKNENKILTANVFSKFTTLTQIK